MIRDAISPRLAIRSFLMPTGVFTGDVTGVLTGMLPGVLIGVLLGMLIGAYIRKTPKPRRPSTGPECAADSAMPSTDRVSRGSITPSS